MKLKRKKKCFEKNVELMFLCEFVSYFYTQMKKVIIDEKR